MINFLPPPSEPDDNEDLFNTLYENENSINVDASFIESVKLAALDISDKVFETHAEAQADCLDTLGTTFWSSDYSQFDEIYKVSTLLKVSGCKVTLRSDGYYDRVFSFGLAK